MSELDDLRRRVREVEAASMGGTLYDWEQCPFCGATMPDERPLRRHLDARMGSWPHRGARR